MSPAPAAYDDLPATDPREVVASLAGFGRALRDAGVIVGTGDLLAFTDAMALLDLADLMDLYWGGRTTLVHRRDDLPVYDEVFRTYFLGTPAAPGPRALPVQPASRAEAAAHLQVPETEPGTEKGEDPPGEMGLQGSAVASLKAKSFAACTPEELLTIRKITKRMRLTPPVRRTRRTTPAADGHAPDLRRMVRDTLRWHGPPPRLRWRERRRRHRRLILVLDVSGSMADYSRALLQFAHTATRSTRRVEVFCFGTRLTRITRQLQHRRPDRALEQAAREVVDWDGGTRIGESLATLVRLWARRGLCRGGVVIICSDGLDRGDPEVLERSLRTLSRLSHRIVWMNPHVSHPGRKGERRPPTGASSIGMMVAEPYVDLLLSGDNLDSLAELADVLPTLR